MNAIAIITYHINVSASRIEELMEGQDIDESDERYREVAMDLLENDISDNTGDYIEMSNEMPDIEVDA
jgi:hypothetical protein